MTAPAGWKMPSGTRDLSQHMAPELTYEVAKLLSGRDPLAPQSAVDPFATIAPPPPLKTAGGEFGGGSKAVAITFGPPMVAAMQAATLAVGHADGTICVYVASASAAPSLLATIGGPQLPRFCGLSAMTTAAAASGGGQWLLASAGTDGHVRWADISDGGWDAASWSKGSSNQAGCATATRAWRVGADGEKGHAGEARAVVLTRSVHDESEELVVAAADHCLRVWDMSTAELVLETAQHKDKVTCVAAGSGKYATGSEDGTIRLYFSD